MKRCSRSSEENIMKKKVTKARRSLKYEYPGCSWLLPTARLGLFDRPALQDGWLVMECHSDLHIDHSPL